jgi:hypothetical protein
MARRSLRPTGLEVSGKQPDNGEDMTNTNQRHEDWAGDPVEEIKAQIRWINEMLKQLKFKTPAKETKH